MSGHVVKRNIIVGIKVENIGSLIQAFHFVMDVFEDYRKHHGQAVFESGSSPFMFPSVFSCTFGNVYKISQMHN